MIGGNGMKYYSEEIVRKIYENALIVGIDEAISKAKSIELPDKYGRLKDIDALISNLPKTEFSSLVKMAIEVTLLAAPTVVEATE